MLVQQTRKLFGNNLRGRHTDQFHGLSEVSWNFFKNAMYSIAGDLSSQSSTQYIYVQVGLMHK